MEVYTQAVILYKSKENPLKKLYLTGNFIHICTTQIMLESPTVL